MLKKCLRYNIIIICIFVFAIGLFGVHGVSAFLQDKDVILNSFTLKKSSQVKYLYYTIDSKGVKTPVDSLSKYVYVDTEITLGMEDVKDDLINNELFNGMSFIINGVTYKFGDKYVSTEDDVVIEQIYYLKDKVTINPGDGLSYLNKNWHVIAVDDDKVTLLADFNQFEDMSHCINGTSDTYCYYSRNNYQAMKWSSSQINDYLNNIWLSTVDSSYLLDNNICNDNFNTFLEGTSGKSCSGGFVTNKVRLITAAEYNTARNITNSRNWLYGTSNYSLLDSSTSATTRNFYQYTVNTNGNLTNNNYRLYASGALRPVIVVDKKVFENGTMDPGGDAVTPIDPSTITDFNLSSNLKNHSVDGIDENYYASYVGGTDLLITDVNTTYEWTSSDPSIATVEGGFVNFVGTGYVTITAKVNGIEKSITYLAGKEFIKTESYNPGDYLFYNDDVYNVISDSETSVKLLANHLSVGYKTFGSVFTSNFASSNYVSTLNNDFITNQEINVDDLIKQRVCSNPVDTIGECSNGTEYNARLLTKDEYETLKNSVTDTSFLFGDNMGTWNLLDRGNTTSILFWNFYYNTSVTSTGDIVTNTNQGNSYLVRPVIELNKSN